MDQRFVMVSSAKRATIISPSEIGARCYVSTENYMKSRIGLILPYFDGARKHDLTHFQRQAEDEQFVLFYDPERIKRVNLIWRSSLVGLASGYFFTCFFDHELKTIDTKELFVNDEPLEEKWKMLFKELFINDEPLEETWKMLFNFHDFVHPNKLDLIPVYRFDREIPEEKLFAAQCFKNSMDRLSMEVRVRVLGAECGGYP